MSRMLGGDMGCVLWSPGMQYELQHQGNPLTYPMRRPNQHQFGPILSPGVFRTGWVFDAPYACGGSPAYQLTATDDGNTVGHKLDADTWFLWRMDEVLDTDFNVLVDYSGNDRHATCASVAVAAVPRPWTPPRNGDGYPYCGHTGGDFVRDPNGSSTDYTRASDATLIAAAKTQYTIEFFIQWDGQSGTKTLWTWGISGAGNTMLRVDITDTGGLNLLWDTAGVSQQHRTDTGLTTVRFPKNKWVHIGIVKNATNVRFYQDGSFLGEVVKAANTTLSNATVHVYNNLGVNLWLTSSVKDLKFTTRAKTDAEIDTAARLCKTTFELPVEVDTLILYRMNERCNTLTDSGPYGMHMFPTSNTSFGRGVAKGPALMPADNAGRSLYSFDNFYGGFNQWPAEDNFGFTATKFREMISRDAGFTFECWYQIVSPAPLGLSEYGLWCFGDPGQVTADLNFLTVDITSTLKLRFWSEYNADLDSTVTTTNSIPTGTHHLAMRINPTSAGLHSLDIFIDGVFVEQITGITKFNRGEGTTGQAFFLCYGSTESTNIFAGFLDDIRFSGVPRTNAEILESYNRGMGIVDEVTDIDPVITVISTPTLNTDPVVVELYDDSGFNLYQLTCRDHEDAPRYVVYNPSEGFIHPFGGRSTISGAGTQADPYVFTIYRRGRWPTGITLDFEAQAIDDTGNSSMEDIAIDAEEAE